MKKNNRSLGRRLVNLSVIVLLQLAVVLIIIEIGARIFDPLGISYYPNTATYLDTLIKEEPIGYRNRPGLNGEFYGKSVHINSLGLRDREVSPEPLPNEFRILVMGDSFPFGLGVEYEESLPFLLEVLANENSKSEKHYRTINMGVPSYNTEQQLIQLETLGLSLKPNIVILFFITNDIERKMWVFEKRASIIADMAQRSYAASLLYILQKQLVGKFSSDIKRSRVSHYLPDDPQWLTIDRSLTKINRLCQSQGIPFIVFLPQVAEVIEPVLPLLTKIAKREGIPILKSSPFNDLRWSKEDPMRYQNSTVDSHPNPEGNSLYARIAYEHLVRQGIVD